MKVIISQYIYAAIMRNMVNYIPLYVLTFYARLCMMRIFITKKYHAIREQRNFHRFDRGKYFPLDLSVRIELRGNVAIYLSPSRTKSSDGDEIMAKRRERNVPVFQRPERA